MAILFMGYRPRGVAATPGYFIASTPFAGVKSTVGNHGRFQDSTYLAGGSVGNNAGAAVNDEWLEDHWLSTGTYKAALITDKDINRGIAHIRSNGADLGTVDMYSAASLTNQYAEVTGIAVVAGLKVVGTKIASKNASSSSYYFFVQTLSLVRTGA